MNAMFRPDSRRSEVTWMGSIGITAMNSGYKKSNATSLRFVAKENKIYISDKVVLRARNIEKLTFANGKLTISEAPPVEGFKYPEVLVDLQDVSLSFSIKFMNEHLDIFWRSTGVQIVNSHGLVGTFGFLHSLKNYPTLYIVSHITTVHHFPLQASSSARELKSTKCARSSSCPTRSLCL